MIRGVLVCRSLETSDQEGAFRKMDRVITADYTRQISLPEKNISQVDSKVWA